MAPTKLLGSIAGHKEWLLTDGTGGYALGCGDGRQRRRYHGLLTVSALPPIRRILVLGFVEERLVLGCEEVLPFEDLEPHEDFALNTRPLPNQMRWHSQVTVGGKSLGISREVSLRPGGGTTLTYRFDSAPPPGLRLVLRPVLYQRCHHRTLGLDAFGHVVEMPKRQSPTRWSLKTSLLNLGQIHFDLEGGESTLRALPRKYLITYETEVERGFEHEEEVESDFDFEVVPAPESEAIRIHAFTGDGNEAPVEPLPRFVPARTEPAVEKELWKWMLDMAEASNDFVVQGRDQAAIIAGYPWFGCWARDTFLSLNAFCLLTGRFAVARSILDFYASHIEKGLVPNRFYMAPERMSLARDFSAADATLWFLYAAAQYAERSQDREFVLSYLDKVEDIVDWHERGTSFNIRIDDHDGLLYAGHHGVPFTWMHAHIGDRCFTPRNGKPIEVNALLIAALRKWAGLARVAHKDSFAEKLARMAQKANQGLSRFWNERFGWFADVVDTPCTSGYAPDLSLRPNQLVALGLPGIDIPQARRERALRAVRESLLVPPGLRGISPHDPRYQPVYKGSPEERDLAYHSGPAWPWLLGFYVSAQRLAHGDKAHGHIREVLAGVKPFFGRDCVGHLAEIYDGEYPFPSRGCPAQASSLAQILSALAEGYFGLTEIPH